MCRCTGYRGILDAWQSFAIDNKPIDIEELYKLKCLNNNSKNDCKLIKKKIHIINNNNGDNSSEWYYPKLLTDLYALLDQFRVKTYIIVSDGTEKGVYKNDATV